MSKTPNGLKIDGYVRGLPPRAHPMRTVPHEYVARGSGWTRVVRGLAVAATLGAAIWGSITIARGDSISTTCFGNRYKSTCITSHHQDPGPITYTAEEIQAMKAREDAWAKYCDPKNVTGSDGLLRAVYAHKDCDIGAYQ